MKKVSAGISAIVTALAIGQSVMADDTELYVSGGNLNVSSRPQVLIIMDNSGSMENNKVTVSSDYDPNTNYISGSGANRIYFTTGNQPPSLSDNPKYIDITDNGCRSSEAPLAQYGQFTSKFRFHHLGQSAVNNKWRQLTRGEWQNGTYIVDCDTDIVKLDLGASSQSSGIAIGFPMHGSATGYDGSTASMTVAELEAARDAALSGAKFDVANAYTMYTANYLDWYHNHRTETEKTRIRVAKDTIHNLVSTTPGVDFGMAIFNRNGDTSDITETELNNNGGRVIFGIQEMTDTNRASMLTTMEGTPADTWTPLCETLFETYRYFAGLAPMNGRYNATPNYDSAVISNNLYLSPLQDCQAQAYVILITDGAPTNDYQYNSVIASELGASAHEFPISSSDAMTVSDRGTDRSNYLPAIAKFMFENDMKPSATGQQRVVTYTIGFSEGAADAAPILSQTASVGGGTYYAAEDANALKESLTEIFTDILATNASFTSPSVAASASDRTSTRDAVYYGMFLPSDSPRWRGNLKKMRIDAQGRVVDANGELAIGSNGNIDNSACSIWTKASTCTAAENGGDGNDVTIGGVVESMLAQNNRSVKTLAGGAVVDLTLDNLNSAAGSEALLRSRLGVDASVNLNGYVNWLKGVDVDDEDQDGSVADTRDSVFGDPLHSKPLAINYSESGSGDDVRILIGTNQGYLHMFKDSGNSVSESWALFLPELLKNVKSLRENPKTGGHTTYGLDGVPVAYIKDANGDGQITSGDSAWVYVGMRRGGSSYYAFDVTNPDSPSLKWRIDDESTGFEQLGQSWSEPVVTTIPGYANPVVVFGGGYDTNKDIQGAGTEDNVGKALYVVDASSGALVHRFVGENSSGNTSAFATDDSIPNKIALLDSDADGTTDRFYATDTGGNVWRFDLPGVTRAHWSANKFAELGSSTLISDRRFFAEVSVAQTSFEKKQTVSQPGQQDIISAQEIPYDAVVIGSGNRAHPNGSGTSDYLFALQDRQINTQHWTTANLYPEAITTSNLYSVAGDPFGNIGDDADKLSKELALGAKLGWYYPLDSKEKSLSAPLIVAGTAYFTTFTPGDVSNSNSCVAAGQGKLYGFNLQQGIHSFAMNIGSNLPDTPQILVPPKPDDAPNDWNPELRLVGVGGGENRIGTVATGQSLVPSRIYYHHGGK
ncbi:PilC/PilY family type IV pilus protein [uncultured Ferrimonas sp.]|uniref:pilus assembly protein n=1 Tax=uncultured Ferrimonas sp. TaxID=432640 RepID=UPI0026375180|nr:PilC/PilY family type IV pilus protein [uncultured Ferrimonas sp.]